MTMWGFIQTPDWLYVRNQQFPLKAGDVTEKGQGAGGKDRAVKIFRDRGRSPPAQASRAQGDEQDGDGEHDPADGEERDRDPAEVVDVRAEVDARTDAARRVGVHEHGRPVPLVDRPRERGRAGTGCRDTAAVSAGRTGLRAEALARTTS